MANLKVPNLCGASLEFNAIQLEFENLIDDAVNKLEADPSDAAATAAAIFKTLDAEMTNLVPKIPSLPDVSLQSQLKDLSKLTPGSFAHITLLAAIALKFGTELKTRGYDLDDLVKVALAAIVAGTDLCTEVPNFVVPADGSTEAIEKAVESSQPTIDSIEEKSSTIVKNLPWLEEQKENETRVADMQVEGESEEIDVVGGTVTSTTPPTEDKGAYTVNKESKPVTYSDGEGKSTEVKVTTPKEQKGKNISTTGFTKKKIYGIEYFKEADVTSIFGGKSKTFELKRPPIRIVSLKGNNIKSDTRSKVIDGKVKNVTEIKQRYRRIVLPHKINSETPKRKIRRYRNSASYSLDGSTVIVNTRGNTFLPHSKENTPYYDDEDGRIFVVLYEYFSNYDSTVKA